MTTPSRRENPCVILREGNIPCSVWFEDALAYHGVPTVVFDLHLLVPDIDQAADLLIKAGWTSSGTPDYINYFLQDFTSQRRLDPPGFRAATQEPKPWPPPPPSQEPPGPTTTVLLADADWNVEVKDLLPLFSEGFVPPLSLLVDSLIDSLLDSPPSTALQTRLATYISYLYHYSTPLKSEKFALSLKPEHRQFHYDALSKMTFGTAPFIEEQRQIRNEVRGRTRQPLQSSACSSRDQEHYYHSLTNGPADGSVAGDSPEVKAFDSSTPNEATIATNSWLVEESLKHSENSSGEPGSSLEAPETTRNNEEKPLTSPVQPCSDKDATSPHDGTTSLGEGKE
ncbi:hypothetical protein VTI28DRAFT_384 [Corynascus sepedonium]